MKLTHLWPDVGCTIVTCIESLYGLQTRKKIKKSKETSTNDYQLNDPEMSMHCVTVPSRSIQKLMQRQVNYVCLSVLFRPTHYKIALQLYLI